MSDAARRAPPDFLFEAECGVTPVCGVDEVGRGPLAGPILAAAIILDPAHIPEGVADSKMLSPARRAALAARLREVAQIGLGKSSAAEIDALGLTRANDLAMIRAVQALPLTPRHALIDGRRVPPGLACPAQALIKGDTRSLSIAAASIIAKVARDRMMQALAQLYPGYGWERNAGYGTAEHMEAIHRLGITRHHRRRFKPVSEALL